MMLLSCYKAYQRGVFTDEHPCPVTKDEIGDYLQILLPFYLFSNDLQSNHANISVVVPTLAALIEANLEQMVLEDPNQDKFRNDLIDFIKLKFDFELNSKIYQVAALLNVGNLNAWRYRSFGKPYYESAKKHLIDVLKLFNEKKVLPPTSSSSNNSAASKEAMEEGSGGKWLK